MEIEQPGKSEPFAMGRLDDCKDRASQSLDRPGEEAETKTLGYRQFTPRPHEIRIRRF